MAISSSLGKSEVLKAPEVRLTYLVGAFLTLIALIVMTQNYFKYGYSADYSVGLSLAYNLIVYTTYAALSPLIFYFGRRFSLASNRPFKSFLVHLILSVTLGLTHMLFCNVLLYSVDLSSAIIFPRFISKYLTNVIHFHLLAYWAILLLSTYRKRKTSKQQAEITKTMERFTVKKNGRTYFLELEGVFWIEAMDHYQKVHLKNGYHVIKGSMKRLEDRLPSDRFLRIHRSHFVNLQHIQEVQKGRDLRVSLKNGEELSVGPSYQKSLAAVIKS